MLICLSVAAGIIRGGFLDIIHEELNTIKKKVKSYFDFRKTYGAVNNGAKILIVLNVSEVMMWLDYTYLCVYLTLLKELDYFN